jgi:hypothetical protein
MTAAPASAQRITPRFWGMHDFDWRSSPSVSVGSANLTTSGTYWRSVQPRKRAFRWDRLTQQIEAAEAIGAQPMIVLGQTPRWASSCRRSAAYHTCMPRVPAWKRYVTRVAKRFGQRLDYQIWPEPNIVQNWKGSPRQMAVLSMVAARAIQRHAGRGATIVSPAVAVRLPSQQRWMIDYFRQRVGGHRVHSYVDAVAVDPFPEASGTPEDSYRLVASVRRQLRRIGVRKPLWTNEINYGVTGGHRTSRTRLSDRQQRAYVVRTYVLSAAARVQRTYWLGWFAHDTMAINMVSRLGRVRPPARSYRVVHSWLDGSRFSGCSRGQRRVWTCTARKGTELRRIYWREGGTTKVRIGRRGLRLETQAGGVDDSPARVIRVSPRPVMVAWRR